MENDIAGCKTQLTRRKATCVGTCDVQVLLELRRRRERRWRKGKRHGSPQISLYTPLFVTVSQSMFRSSFEVPYEVSLRPERRATDGPASSGQYVRAPMRMAGSPRAVSVRTPPPLIICSTLRSFASRLFGCPFSANSPGREPHSATPGPIWKEACRPFTEQWTIGGRRRAVGPAARPSGGESVERQSTDSSRDRPIPTVYSWVVRRLYPPSSLATPHFIDSVLGPTHQGLWGADPPDFHVDAIPPGTSSTAPRLEWLQRRARALTRRRGLGWTNVHLLEALCA